MGRIGPEILGRLFDEHAAALALYARPVVRRAGGRRPGRVRRAGPAGTGARPGRRLALSRGAQRRDRRVAAIASPSATRAAGRRSGGRTPAARGSTPPTTRSTPSTPPGSSTSLDAETRAIIVARVWGGLTFEEAARLQGCSLTTAHRRYQAGLARLHERLESPWTSTNRRIRTDRPERAGASPGGLAAVRRRARPRPDALRRRPGRGRPQGHRRAWRLATAALARRDCRIECGCSCRSGCERTGSQDRLGRTRGAIATVTLASGRSRHPADRTSGAEQLFRIDRAAHGEPGRRIVARHSRSSASHTGRMPRPRKRLRTRFRSVRETSTACWISDTEI